MVWYSFYKVPLQYLFDVHSNTLAKKGQVFDVSFLLPNVSKILAKPEVEFNLARFQDYLSVTNKWRGIFKEDTNASPTQLHFTIQNRQGKKHTI